MTPVAFAPGSILVCAPLANVVALAARTLQRTVFPPQPMDIGLALFGVEEVVQMGEHWHGGESPGVVNPVPYWMGDSHMLMTFLRSYKLMEWTHPLYT